MKQNPRFRVNRERAKTSRRVAVDLLCPSVI